MINKTYSEHSNDVLLEEMKLKRKQENLLEERRLEKIQKEKLKEQRKLEKIQNEKLGAFQCAYCGNKYSQKHNLKAHIK